ncbi:MAG: 4a-hydroxytetrahydrobiopterin dehydratase [Bacteroidia bacterium]|jgi:4a-hydroxytetrahydrobiopterin dehydratase|nr:4a-hydroxytetrahydrobiopterin dehydratase [Bacteroidia bacterium]
MENWEEKDYALQKTFKFNTFTDAINWMYKASAIIDEFNHHPEWTNIYNKVHVTLRTHDAGNIITEKDYQLAKLLDEV